MADTIFALASAPGKAGVAVVRLSGEQAWDVAGRLMTDLPQERLASVRRLTALDGSVIDEALVLVFGSGASFTGEPTVEFQTHGSMAVVSRLARELASFDGVREAEAGEFTRRALENDRLSLVQVEGLADLIEAETELQRRQALQGFSGRTAETVDGWREDLIHAAALLEAVIDFADEDVPVDVSDEVSETLGRLSDSLQKELRGYGAAERVRAGFEVAIVGPPNIGKSTLLNCIAGREVAITSEIAGTTRDVIEVRVDLSGMAVTFLDTAGMREASDQIERIGVDLAQRRASAADLRVHLIEPGQTSVFEVRDQDVVVTGKADVFGHDGVSGVSGQGVSSLLDQVTSILADRVSDAGSLTRSRHFGLVSESLDFLQAAQRELEFGPDNYVIVGEEIRSAARRLDALIGRVDVEHVLDRIFASFCIGK